MILVDENMSVKEVRKGINEIIRPIKVFIDLWDVHFEYVDDVIKAVKIEDWINNIVEYVYNYTTDDTERESAIVRANDLKCRLDLLAMSIERLKPLEKFLVYNVLLSDKTQIELTKDERLWKQYGVANISPAKINHLVQAVSLKLLEIMKYNQIKNGQLNFN